MVSEDSCFLIDQYRNQHIDEREYEFERTEQLLSQNSIEDYQQWTTEHQLLLLVKSLESLNLPDPQHIEDFHDLTAAEMQPIFNLRQADIDNSSIGKPSEMNKLLVSDPVSLPGNISTSSWADGDSIPTRVPSVVSLDAFPPLVRCRECPAMGYPEDFSLDRYCDDEESGILYSSDSSYLGTDDERCESDCEMTSQSSSLSFYYKTEMKFRHEKQK